MAKITRIKAGESSSKEKDEEPTITRKKVVVKDKKVAKQKQKEIRKAKKKALKSEKKTDEKKPFILFRPFVYLGRYLRDSWREIRQVRWPNRKATWKMVLAVFVYTLIFGGFLLLLDILFDLIFSKLLG